MSLLCIQQLTTRHVGPIDLCVEAGECITVEGSSGSGKSLLLRAVADLDPHQGEVTVDGVASRDLPPPQWRQRVTLIPAESQWWAERIGDHFEQVDEAGLAQLGFSPETLEWEVARCSTGERQRLALLRALQNRPQVLLLDEPTASLDEQSTERVEQLLDSYRREHGAALLWVSHDRRQAARVAARHLVMQDGALQIREVTQP